MNKKSLILILIFLLAASIYAGGNKETKILNFKGNIDYLEGNVSLNNTPAEFGSEVRTGDIIKTGSNSSCDIVFNKGNILHMESDTILQINWNKSTLNLKEGSIASVFNKLNKVIGVNEQFQIITPTATAGIRGTSFYIKVEDEFNTYICTCNGSLILSGNGIDNFASTSKHHKAYRFTKSGNKVQVKSAGLLYHDDPLMNSVADVIGVKIPWDLSKY